MQFQFSFAFHASSLFVVYLLIKTEEEWKKKEYRKIKLRESWPPQYSIFERATGSSSSTPINMRVTYKQYNISSINIIYISINVGNSIISISHIQNVFRKKRIILLEDWITFLSRWRLKRSWKLSVLIIILVPRLYIPINILACVELRFRRGMSWHLVWNIKIDSFFSSFTGNRNWYIKKNAHNNFFLGNVHRKTHCYCYGMVNSVCSIVIKDVILSPAV